MDRASKAEWIGRIHRLQEQMDSAGIDLFIITQNVDIYYFTGSMQSGYLVVPVSGEAVYYVRRSLSRAIEESYVQRTEPLGSFRSWGVKLKEDFPHVFSNAATRPVCATEYDVTPVQLMERLQNAVGLAEWRDGSRIIRELRMVKSDYEISKIKEAARIVDAAFINALGYMRIGMPEYELIARIEFDLRMNGHLGLMRMRAYNQEIITGVVGAGDAVAKPTYFDGPGGGTGLSPASPQGAGRRRFRSNEPILVDIGCCIDGYVIDQTRTVSLGPIADDLKSAYQTAEQILRNSESRLRPGVLCEELYMEALRVADDAGLSEHFMGYGTDQVKFLGHGIGLEIDEWPVLAKGAGLSLQPGMVIAIEPKFTYPDRGIVGIENSYAITKDGYEKLTLSQEGIILI